MPLRLTWWGVQRRIRPFLAKNRSGCSAVVAHRLPKPLVGGSNPLTRSNFSPLQLTLALGGLAALGLAACGAEPSYERDFQTEVVNRSTQAEVRAKFGAPELVTVLDNGEVIWNYRYSRGTFSSGYAASSECWQYSLTFDPKGVLRDATEVSCSGTLRGYDPTEDEKYLKTPGERSPP
jgi:hypothetical protein